MYSLFIIFIPVPKISKFWRAERTSFSLILSFTGLELFNLTTSFIEIRPPLIYFVF